MATSDSESEISAAERAAMKDLAAEKRRAKSTKGVAKKAADAKAFAEKVAAMNDEDRALAEALDRIVTAAAPDAERKTWYGMPAWAKAGKVICFFQEAGKRKARYATLSFNDPAALDDGAMWATAFAVIEIGAEDEARLAELVARAFG